MTARKGATTALPTTMRDALLRASVVNPKSPTVKAVIRKVKAGRGVIQRRQMWNRQRGQS